VAVSLSEAAARTGGKPLAPRQRPDRAFKLPLGGARSGLAEHQPVKHARCSAGVPGKLAIASGAAVTADRDSALFPESQPYSTVPPGSATRLRLPQPDSLPARGTANGGSRLPLTVST
jgi:hypothetical protein